MRFQLSRFQHELSSAVAASGEVHHQRTHLLLQVWHEGVSGYGELSPQPHALNGDPSYAEVEIELESLLRSVLGAHEREGSVPHWSRISRFQGSRASSAPAALLVEMALLDWHLRREARPLASEWAPQFAPGTMETRSALGTNWVPLGPETVQLRVKLARTPLEQHVIERIRQSGCPVLLDYNCVGPTTEEIQSHLSSLEGVAIVAVEQPYAPGNVVDHALLAQALSVPVSLDEGVRSRRDLDHIARYDAATLVCLKPARLGGYSVARSCADHARGLGLVPYIGGFFEDVLGRAVNRTLARASVSAASDLGDPTFVSAQDWQPDDVGFGWVPGPAFVHEVIGTFGAVGE